MPNPGRLIFSIADIPIAIEGDARLPEWKIPPAYRPFIAAGKQDLLLGLHSGIPATPDGKKVFDSSPIWTLYRYPHAAVFKIFDHFGPLKQRLLIPPDFKRADLYFDEKCDHVMGPFAGPAMELMMINYLAWTSGIILHACGIEHQGKGYLFAGESGAGKSTLSGLWDRDKAVQVLSDDRTILRKQGGTLRIYGTPWHGDMPIGSPRGIQLARIFFLGRGDKNAVRELKGSSSMLRLLQCSFPPFWDAPGMEAAMELLEELATRVSCCELSFKPDHSAIGFLKGII
ncbi:MAG: hypothetical protein PVI13_05150 [Desulfobacterales bacterium]|jgi:hypothetical protein